MSSEDKLKWDTKVTIDENRNLVTRAYCSAFPVAYSHIESEHWAEFARLILEASYEATFHAALSNYVNTGNDKVFLTLVGGGAFGNKSEWIYEAIKRSINKFSNTPLDIKIVSHGRSKLKVSELVESIKLYLQ